MKFVAIIEFPNTPGIPGKTVPSAADLQTFLQAQLSANGSYPPSTVEGVFQKGGGS